ncbi:MAG: sulfide/dihydroorotate dehydrogenase-like FAD/NAD-binding protein [Planctomycetaceae bacterium]|jgi:ferredoxin--NADP+ reductase|nr:sulfide/dihydroorotate dehydrogenase-like FAD/NAD-binding protein [Planctomycetaceae bacterium]
MFKIISNKELAPNIFEMVVEHKRLSLKARAGHFVIVMPDESGERIPLTIADFDRQAGTITLVIMAIGTSTMKLVSLKSGSSLYALIGPLGVESEIENYGTVIMAAGGVGTAPVFPIARELHEKGNRVISIQGARTKELLFWTDKLAAVSDSHIITTDDGSEGRKGLVTEPLKELLEKEKDKIGCVYMIGPAVMMKFCSQVVIPYGVKSVASLNSIMIDGTGMCGGCRVKVGKETKFTCVDGPEFDASQIDWDILLSRQKMYCNEEKCSLNKYKNTHGTL